MSQPDLTVPSQAKPSQPPTPSRHQVKENWTDCCENDQREHKLKTPSTMRPEHRRHATPGRTAATLDCAWQYDINRNRKKRRASVCVYVLHFISIRYHRYKKQQEGRRTKYGKIIPCTVGGICT